MNEFEKNHTNVQQSSAQPPGNTAGFPEQNNSGQPWPSQSLETPQIPVYVHDSANPVRGDRKSLIATIVVMAFLLAGAGIYILINSGMFCRHHWVAASCESIAYCEFCNKSSGRTAGHQWQEATCSKEKTCKVCSMKQGEPLAHQWTAATCDKPKTCTLCGNTEGTPLGHTYDSPSCDKPSKCTVCGEDSTTPTGHKYSEATCDKPAVCTVCGTSEGAPLGHLWQNATCLSPKTCSRCGSTEGSASGHNWTAATVSSPKKCTVCGITEGGALSLTYLGSGYVNAATGLNLRKSPDTSSGVITIMPNGSSLSVYGCGTNGWYYVTYGSSSGYASADYVSFGSNYSYSYSSSYNGFKYYSGSYRTVSTNGGVLNIRTGPSQSYSVIGEIPNGTTVYAYSTDTNWYFVQYGGHKGFISGDWLS